MRIATGCIVLLVIATDLATASFGPLAAAAGIVIAIAAAVSAVGRYRLIPLALAVIAVAASPMIAVRVTESLTVGDVLLLAALAAAVIGAPRLYPLPQVWWAVTLVVAMMLLGGLVATFIVPSSITAGAAEYLQYAAATLTTLGFVVALRPNRQVVRLLCWAYGCGAAISAVVAITSHTIDHRPVGLTNQPNHLGISCALGAAALLALAITASRAAARLAGCGVAALCMWGVVLSGSRAGVIVLVVAVVGAVVGCRSGRVIASVVILLGGATVAVYGGIIPVGNNNAVLRVLGGGTADEADVGRAYHYARGWARIEANPLFGSGFANSRDGHSLYLQMWDAAGVLGVLAAMLLMVVCIGSWVQARRRGDRLSVGLWSGYGGYLTAAVVSNQMWDRYLWLALMLAILGSATATLNRRPVSDGAPGVGRDVVLSAT